ncbi:MAG: rod shape-determining protein MreD [Anaerolineae bacterium]|nr:rod shape-determining protein MreD [Anaerolineae bacterium]
MSNYAALPIVFLAAVLQATFIPQIRIFGGTPDLAFLFFLSWATNSPLETGVIWAFAGGIAVDLLSAAPTGTSVIGLLLIVFAIDALRRQFVNISLPLVVALLVGGTMLHKLVFAFVMILSGFGINLFEYSIYVVAPTIAYNLIFALPVFWLSRKLRPRREGRVSP